MQYDAAMNHFNREYLHLVDRTERMLARPPLPVDPPWYRAPLLIEASRPEIRQLMEPLPVWSEGVARLVGTEPDYLVNLSARLSPVEIVRQVPVDPLAPRSPLAGPADFPYGQLARSLRTTLDLEYPKYRILGQPGFGAVQQGEMIDSIGPDFIDATKIGFFFFMDTYKERSAYITVRTEGWLNDARWKHHRPFIRERRDVAQLKLREAWKVNGA